MSWYLNLGMTDYHMAPPSRSKIGGVTLNMTEEEEMWFDEATSKKFHFDGGGKLVDCDGNAPGTKFRKTDEFSFWVHKVVVKMMLSEGLIEREHPENGAPIYVTPNAFDSPNKLLVLIQGSGHVRAGVFSSRVCADVGIEAGTVMPSIREAKSRGMEVVVLNPNDERNTMFSERYQTKVGMIRHTLAIFEDLIIPSNPQRVFILCHSMGGECTVSVLNNFPRWSIEHIRAIAMTDALESKVACDGLKMRNWCLDHITNWLCSTSEVNKALNDGIASTHLSAGTLDHTLSTYSAFDYVWDLFDKKGADLDEVEPTNLEKYEGEEESFEDASDTPPKCRPA